MTIAFLEVSLDPLYFQNEHLAAPEDIQLSLADIHSIFIILLPVISTDQLLDRALDPDHDVLHNSWLKALLQEYLGTFGLEMLNICV